MKTCLWSVFYAIAVLILVPSLMAQCPGGYTQITATAYATRSGADLVTEVIATMSGGDEANSIVTVTQTDTTNGQVVAQPFTGSSPNPGESAYTSRTTNLNSGPWGQHTVYGTIGSLDECTGIAYPPYTDGWNGQTNTVTFSQNQPQAFVNSETYVAAFTIPSSPTSSGGVYPAQARFQTASNPGIVGAPAWTFTGAVNQWVFNCANCTEADATPLSSATISCSPSIHGSYVIDGLQSNSVSTILEGPVQLPTTDPVYGGHVTNYAYGSTGYDSYWFYYVIDTCGASMEGIPISETFPNGFFREDSGNNWDLPTAGTWYAQSGGGWFDDIGQHNESAPPSLPPQNPLTNIEIYYGNQIIYALPWIIPISTDVQAHFQDHGGYN